MFDPAHKEQNEKITISPAKMYAHGITRAGYIEVPRDPQLAYEFLKVEARTIQHYGIQRDHLIYKAKARRRHLDPAAATCKARTGAR